MKYKSESWEYLKHSLFGRENTRVYKHEVFTLYLTIYNGSYNCHFKVLSQSVICEGVPPTMPAIHLKELTDYSIYVNDYYKGPSEILIGSDVAEKIITGGYKSLLCGLTAMETRLGWTIMGRIPQIASEIGSKTDKTTKPSIWIDGGIHAREWISPATVTYIASRLVEDYDANDEVKSLVNDFDWYIMPIVNPDGYEFSHMFNRMWRKNRRGGMIFCKGTDLNRNFDFHWREGGSSRSPCSDTYAGSGAFSEPESKAVSDFVLKRKENFVAFLAVHSYSQLWLTPWGYTSDLPDDYDEMVAVAQEATQALSEVHGTQYRIGSSTNVLYVATGGADDWAKGVAGIKYSYTIELRDTGRYGFMLPSEQIIPTGEETWAGVKAMAKAIKRGM